MKKKFAVILTAVAVAVVFPCLSACTHKHTPVEVAAQEATCETAGNVKYWKCDCGKYFADADGTEVLEESEITIEPLGHDYEWTVTQYPTLSAEGSKDGVCRRDESHKTTEKIDKLTVDDPEALKNFEYTDEGYITGLKNTELENVVIPNGMLYIWTNAFKDCTRIKSITIPNSITFISSAAFEGCSSLTSVTIPDSVTYLGKYSFRFCSNLQTVVLGKGLKLVEDNAFKSCTKLETINIPDNVTIIGSNAFNGCSALKSINIPNTVTEIRGPAFMSSGLETVTIPASVVKIGAFAFASCPSLTTINCEAASKPEGWKDDWSYGFSGNLVWGFSK